MSATRRVGFVGDDEAVSEVVGYILSFAVAFLILVATMATFGIVADSGSRLAASAQAQDTSNRVAAAVLEVFEVGAAIRTTGSSIDSGTVDPLSYRRTLDVPAEFRGFFYTIEINSRYVFTNSTDLTIKTNSTIFKADVVVAPPGGCTAGHVVCTIDGSVLSGASTVAVWYTYDPSASPLVNRIRIE